MNTYKFLIKKRDLLEKQVKKFALCKSREEQFEQIVLRYKINFLIELMNEL